MKDLIIILLISPLIFLAVLIFFIVLGFMFASLAPIAFYYDLKGKENIWMI